MLDHDRHVIHSSEESDWRTPPALFQALDAEFFFDVDAAADKSSALAAHYFGPDHTDPGLLNALEVDWYAYGTRVGHTPYFFLNPPFSRKKARALKAVGDATWAHYTVEAWAEKCWVESQRGCTIVAVLPFAPQTDWYRRYVYGHAPSADGAIWSGHAALQERRLPHRISFLRPDGGPASNAGVNSAIIVWGPATGMVGPWTPHSFYWSYRGTPND